MNLGTTTNPSERVAALVGMIYLRDQGRHVWELVKHNVPQDEMRLVVMGGDITVTYLGVRDGELFARSDYYGLAVYGIGKDVSLAKAADLIIRQAEGRIDGSIPRTPQRQKRNAA